MSMKYFKVHWKNNTTSYLSGTGIADAFSMSGYSVGSVSAIDFWEEVYELPRDKKEIAIVKGKEVLSCITNPAFTKKIREAINEGLSEVTVRFMDRDFSYYISETPFLIECRDYKD